MKIGRTIHDSTIRYIARSREGVVLPEETVIKVDSDITQVVQGRDHILILDSSGKVYGLGDNSFYQAVPLSKKSTWRQVHIFITAAGGKGGAMTGKLAKQPSDQLSNNSPTNTQAEKDSRSQRKSHNFQRSLEYRKSVEPRGTISPRGSVQASVTPTPALPLMSDGNMQPKVSVFHPEPIKVLFPGRAIARVQYIRKYIAKPTIGSATCIYGERI